MPPREKLSHHADTSKFGLETCQQSYASGCFLVGGPWHVPKSLSSVLRDDGIVHSLVLSVCREGSLRSVFGDPALFFASQGSLYFSPCAARPSPKIGIARTPTKVHVQVIATGEDYGQKYILVKNSGLISSFSKNKRQSQSTPPLILKVRFNLIFELSPESYKTK
jgi:hypothetical protein